MPRLSSRPLGISRESASIKAFEGKRVPVFTQSGVLVGWTKPAKSGK